MPSVSQMMRIFLAIFMILTSVTQMSANQPMLSNISKLQWQNRILLVWTEDSPKYLDIFQKNKAEIDDRDLIWFVINKTQLNTNYPGKIADDFLQDLNKQISPKANEVILIGKDGGIKRRKSEVSLTSLFRQIDSMPMRQSEIRRKQATDK